MALKYRHLEWKRITEEAAEELSRSHSRLTKGEKMESIVHEKLEKIQSNIRKQQKR